MAAVGIEVGLERQQCLERGVGTVALVTITADFFGADYGSSLLVQHRFGYFYGRDFGSKETFLLGPGSALLADQGIFILGLAADLITLGDDLGGFAHHHVEARKFLLDRRAGVVVANDEADGFNASSNGGVSAF